MGKKFLLIKEMSDEELLEELDKQKEWAKEDRGKRAYRRDGYIANLQEAAERRGLLLGDGD